MPPADQGYSISYDGARDRIVLVPSDIYSGVYEFDGSVWTKVDPAIAPSLGL